MACGILLLYFISLQGVLFFLHKLLTTFAILVIGLSENESMINVTVSFAEYFTVIGFDVRVMRLVLLIFFINSCV